MNLKGNQDAYGFAETHEFFVVCTKDKTICSLGMFPVEDEELMKIGWKMSMDFIKKQII